jgi:protein-S-isoprenylcysteine O-methyltransferase Ste14
VTSARQRIVQAGPYSLLRHPGYLGNILMWLGAALATGNWITLDLAVLTMLTAYLYRIHSEEAMLRTAFGEEFENYQARTWRLIPRFY